MTRKRFFFLTLEKNLENELKREKTERKLLHMSERKTCTNNLDNSSRYYLPSKTRRSRDVYHRTPRGNLCFYASH